MLELTNSAIKADNESVHEVLSQKAKEVKPTNVLKRKHQPICWNWNKDVDVGTWKT